MGPRVDRMGFLGNQELEVQGLRVGETREEAGIAGVGEAVCGVTTAHRWALGETHQEQGLGSGSRKAADGSCGWLLGGSSLLPPPVSPLSSALWVTVSVTTSSLPGVQPCWIWFTPGLLHHHLGTKAVPNRSPFAVPREARLLEESPEALLSLL